MLRIPWKFCIKITRNLSMSRELILRPRQMTKIWIQCHRQTSCLLQQAFSFWWLMLFWYDFGMKNDIKSLKLWCETIETIFYFVDYVNSVNSLLQKIGEQVRRMFTLPLQCYHDLENNNNNKYCCQLPQFDSTEEGP